MAQKISGVRTVAAVGIGAALVFVLMRFVAIPSGVPNTNLNLGIAALTVFAAIFGPVAGFLIGLIAHTLTDLTWGSLWWSWIIADALYGLLIGLFWKVLNIEEGNFTLKKCFLFNGIQILGNALAWAVIAPVLDILIYREPADKVFIQGIVAAALNAAVILVLGSLLLFGYSKTRVKTGSLKQE
jgi:energy-coupling factor transport system substrate-specific component